MAAKEDVGAHAGVAAKAGAVVAIGVATTVGTEDTAGVAIIQTVYSVTAPDVFFELLVNSSEVHWRIG